jgi:hypothetical protein
MTQLINSSLTVKQGCQKAKLSTGDVYGKVCAACSPLGRKANFQVDKTNELCSARPSQEDIVNKLLHDYLLSLVDAKSLCQPSLKQLVLRVRRYKDA